MGIPSTGGLLVRPEGAQTTAADVSCRECPPCRRGHTYWCSAPARASTHVDFATGDWELVLRWLALLASLVDRRPPPGQPLLVLSRQPQDTVVHLVGRVHDGPVIASTDGRDIDSRNALATLTATGRATTVAATHNARAAVRSVQRGGVVHLPDLSVSLPSVTEVVQRDVRLLGPQTTSVFYDQRLASSWGADFDALFRPLLQHKEPHSE